MVAVGVRMVAAAGPTADGGGWGEARAAQMATRNASAARTAAKSASAPPSAAAGDGVLRLWCAPEACIEFDEHDAAVRGEHVASVQDPTIRLATLAAEGSHARPVDGARLVEHSLVDKRQQVVGTRVRAHATRVGAGVALVPASSTGRVPAMKEGGG